MLIQIPLITKIGSREGFKSSISTSLATAATSLNFLLLTSTLGTLDRDALFERICPTARKMWRNSRDISGVNLPPYSKLVQNRPDSFQFPFQ